MAGTLTLEMTAGGVRPLRMMGDVDLKVLPGRWAFSTSYTTGGETVGLLATSSAANYFNQVYGAWFAPAVSGTAITQALLVSYNPSTDKARALSATTGGIQEVVGTADLSGFTFRFIAYGL
jgi:hypothetical protein